MNTMYDSDIDFLEVIEPGNKTVAVDMSDALTLFFRDDNSRSIVGFCLEAASTHLSELTMVPPNMRLAGVIRVTRGVLRLSQAELAEKVDIGMRTLQRFEAGEGNPTFEALLNILNVAPDSLDFSVLLRKIPAKTAS